MIILGGDLFHDNKPSRLTMYKTMELFRKYCMGGSQPVQFDTVCDPEDLFHDEFKTFNFEDASFGVSLPVFIIHGNHDDPTGESNLCALDLLSVNGLINYFGKARDVSDIRLKPILFQKGSTRMCLYGLGNIRDERLHRAFVSKQVKLLQPEKDPEEWFNLMVIHQNRFGT